MKYTVGVAGKTFEVEVKGDEVWVNGRKCHARLSGIPHTPLHHLALDDHSHTVALVRDGDRWVVQLAGMRWPVTVEDERTRALRAVAGRRPGRGVGGVVRAPMPGLVLQVEVEERQRVEAGAGVVVLEAMKMENEIVAPAAGIVRQVFVAPGEAVEKGAPLVEIGDA